MENQPGNPEVNALNEAVCHNKRASSTKSDCASKFFRTLIVAGLGRMQRGRLTVTDVNGDHLVFGDRDASGAQNCTIQAHLTINSEEFFKRVALFGDIGLAEAYIDGLWDTPDIRAFLSFVLLNVDGSPFLNESKAKSRFFNFLGAFNRLLHLSKSNSRENSKTNIRDHYDLGNEFFALFLDASMTYSSALYAHGQAGGSTLALAQQAKYERICQQLRLSEQDRLLEIGCGWGGFSLYAAKNFGCHITAVTISQRQYDYVEQLIERERLGNFIDLHLKDYRDLSGSFDKIVSIEMIEAVGDEHLDDYVACCNRLLKTGGLLALQMIIVPDARYDTQRKNVNFIQKHIFPGSLLPSLRRLSQAMQKNGELSLYNLHDMGPSYVRTLKEWQNNFNRSLERINDFGFDDQFVRKWNYYFSCCQATFDMRSATVVQAVYTNPNNLALRGQARE